MSLINANNITNVNATITNLNVHYINGIVASKFGNCCSCNDICPLEPDEHNHCPQCNSYDNCCCEHDAHDGGCPECILYSQCSCNCHGSGGGGSSQCTTGAQSFQGATGAHVSQGFQGATGAQVSQ